MGRVAHHLQIDGSSLEDALAGLLDADGYRATVTE
jgi:hypothetical protein